MYKLNSKLKSILTLLFVVIISLISLQSIIYLTKKITTENEVSYYYWNSFNVKDSNLLNGKLYFKFIDNKNREYSLISDENCSYNSNKFEKLKKDTISIEISVVKIKNIFNSKTIEKIRFEEDYKNYFCD